MKHWHLTLSAAAMLLTAGARAETTVTLSGVHLCCNGCAKAVEKAVATVADATVACDQDAGTAAITAPSATAAQKAVDAIVAAGFFGASSDPSVKPKSAAGAPSGKVESATVSGVHLCCGSCAKAANGAAMGVAGVQASNAAKGAASFTVTGNFSAKELAASLEKAGLSGRISR